MSDEEEEIIWVEEDDPYLQAFQNFQAASSASSRSRVQTVYTYSDSDAEAEGGAANAGAAGSSNPRAAASSHHCATQAQEAPSPSRRRKRKAPAAHGAPHHTGANDVTTKPDKKVMGWKFMGRSDDPLTFMRDHGEKARPTNRPTHPRAPSPLVPSHPLALQPDAGVAPPPLRPPRLHGAGGPSIYRR
jgi:hypothetical protein